MKFNDLKVSSKSPRGRVGRGIAAGRGKTAGRGTKGQKSRAGRKRRPGFEGGQNPLMQRLPKMRGFKSIGVQTETVSLNDITAIKGTVDNFSLHEAGLVSSPHVPAKLVGNAKLESKVVVKLQGVSQAALESIEKAGGSFSKVPRVARVSSKK